MMAAPNTLPWIVRTLPALDTDDEVAQLATLRNVRGMMADGRLSWTAIAAMIPLRRAPHLELDAVVNAETVGRLLRGDLNRVPLSEQPSLGALQQRLRAGHRATPDDIKRVRRVRQAVAGAST